MTQPRYVAVIDIGKTNAKLALVDLASLKEVAVVTRSNEVLPGPPWPHYDLDGHWAFLLDNLAAFHRDHGVDAISATTHGASMVLLAADGRLAAPMIDYEFDGPDSLDAAFQKIRPPFSETGTPRQHRGLSVGAQIHYMFHQDPGLAAQTASLVTYPQYWGFRLTGVQSTELTSLGCHTDLWRPYEARPSSLAEHLGVAGKLAPVRAASEVLGPILPEIAQRTGLPADTPVFVGVHDSNASLLPYLLAREAPFSVVSTGTWVVALSVGGEPEDLGAFPDTVINHNALGQPLPSVRLMGGREYEIAMDGARVEPTDADIRAVLESGVMLLPALVPDAGPLQGRTARWEGGEPEAGSGVRAAATAFYLALVTGFALEIVGHRGRIFVEGPFAHNDAFLDMLAAATSSPVEAAASATGTAQGAALLAAGGAYPPGLGATAEERRDPGVDWRRYAEDWRRIVEV